ncbi:DUF4038 domain-containing protein [Candidatus Poribacteria bacterium]|nr:DUF4038 domain-containing protein [Candidatus Poribacteria bacterium]
MALLATVTLYGIYDFIIHTDSEFDNPFLVEVCAVMEHDSGERIEGIPAFYNDNGDWIVRFSPDKKGRWKGWTKSKEPSLSGIKLEEIECIDNENHNIHGKLIIDPQNTQKFLCEDNTPFVIMGFECDWLFSYHQRNPALCHKQIKLIKDRGFNYVIMNIYAHTGFSQPESRFEGKTIPDTVYGPPDMYVFGGNNENPNHAKLNIDFFKDYDKLMNILQQNGIVAHIMIQVQNKHVKWPERLSVEDDIYWKYVVARYQAFRNIVWDVGKESYNLFRSTESHEYTISRIDLIRKIDAYKHLVTVHDPEAGSQGRYSEIDEIVDFCSDQVHLKDVERYNREALKKLRLFPKPYINIEYGYELGVEDLKTYKSRTTASWQDVLKWTYAIYMAGAYPGYYYSNTSWDLIKFEPEPESWIRYKYLRDILDSISFNQMESMNILVEEGYCLANLGKEYMVFLNEGGNAVIDLTDILNKKGERGQLLTEDKKVKTIWMDIYTGEKHDMYIKPKGWSTLIENPLSDKSNPCILVIKKSK